MRGECFSLILSLHWNIETTEGSIIFNNTWNTLDSCEKAFDVFYKFNTLVTSHEVYSPISYAIVLNDLM